MNVRFIKVEIVCESYVSSMEVPLNSLFGPISSDANIVFVDSPSGTGYSYSNTTSDYSVFTDQSTGTNFLALSCSLIINLSEKSDILDSFLSIS